MDLETLRRKVSALDERLRPIAGKPVPFGRDMLARLAAAPSPLDEASVREEADAVLLAAINLYACGSSETRHAIRELFRRNHAFGWAATLPFPPDNGIRFRQHLIHFSIADQGRDPRDALLWLRDLVASWHDDSIRREVAEMSIDEDRFGYGSTKALLSGR